MNLVVNNLHAEVRLDGGESDAWLRDYLTVDDPNAEFSPAFQAGQWDGKIHLYEPKHHRFAAGLTRLVVTRARAIGVRVDVTDVRGDRPHVDLTAGAWLRDYQRAPFEALLRRTRGVVDMPVGSGKTELAAAWTQAVRQPWLVLVDAKHLMYQMAERIQLRTGEEPGILGDSEWRVRRVNVGTFQTMHARLELGNEAAARVLEAARGLIVDEVHVVAAKTMYAVAMATPNAYFRAGISATPFDRGDERDYWAIAALGPAVYSIAPMELVERGVLARPDIRFVEHQHQKMTGTWAEVYEAGVVLDEARNQLVLDLASSSDLCPRPCLTFVQSLRHGEHLARELRARGVDSQFLRGEDSVAARQAAVRRLRSGRLKVLVASRIFNKGVDIPVIASMINAAGGDGYIDAHQRLGRGMRLAAGKEKVVFWDVLDLGNRWLERHARGRIEAYRSRKFPVTVLAGIPGQ